MRHWLIQSSGLRRTDEAVNALLTALEEADVEWSDFGVIPFTTELTNWENLPEGKSFFPHCSTKVLRLLKNNKLLATQIFNGCDPLKAIKLQAAMQEGVFYDEDAFDMAKYLHHKTPYGPLKQFLLNGDGIVWYLSNGEQHSGLMSNETLTYTVPMFVKPTKDLKMFAGGIMEIGTTFPQFMSQQQVDSALNLEWNEETVIMAYAKNILAEWRFFVVNELVVAQSQYRKHGKLEYHSYVPPYVIDYAEHLASLYQPAKAFTMDVCLTDDLELKIVEYNCINCSGLYHASITDLAHALNTL